MVNDVIILFWLMCLSGFFGRAGGAGKSGKWYDFLLNTKTRDLGCPAVLIAFTCVYFGFNASLWYVYVLAYLLTFGSFCTYWDKLFGYDCLWFSGMVVGVAGLPLMWVSGDLWWIWVIRICVLAVVWELLNKKLPKRVFIWGRDVVEEFSRYAISL